MKKMFTKRLLIYMVMALIVTIGAIFILQTFSAKSTNTESAKEQIEMVKGKLKSNDEEIDKLVKSLSENNLVKTRAFAEILATDPSVLTDSTRMQEICEEFMVNELHVINKEGIITHSTIADYVGFDMNSGEQSAAFMEIVRDPSVELVQEPQENVKEGVVIQYIGVARKDDEGLVQVGIRPEILEDTLANTKIDVVLSDIEYGDKGYAYAVDAKDGTILAHPNQELIGKDATENGLEVKEGKGKAKVDGTTGYYQAETYDGKVIGVFLPAKEYYQNRISQTLVVSVSMFVIFMVLLLVINKTVDIQIVSGINRIAESVKKIAGGDFKVIVKEESNPEFIRLSEDINKMVENIRSSMSDNERLLVQQKADIENIKGVCGELGTVSQRTLSSADEIFHGTEQQKQSVDDLNQVMGTLVNELNSSADASVGVAKMTEEAVSAILDTQKQMNVLEDAISHISEMSKEIGKIVIKIDSIANQTNLLALNASVEAARAGEMGKGFAVVATEVGSLAARSSQAAKETGELISNSIQAVSDGLVLAQDTSSTFGNVVKEIEHANAEVKRIAGMVRKNAADVEHTATEMDKIRNVMDNNAQISESSKRISVNMADITDRLLNMFGEQ